MPVNLAALRQLVAMDHEDPVTRFTLGQKLVEEDGSPEALQEAEGHLRFAAEHAPNHIAAYWILAQALARLGRPQEARTAVEHGIDRAAVAPHGSGQDLLPEMEEFLESLP